MATKKKPAKKTTTKKAATKKTAKKKTATKKAATKKAATQKTAKKKTAKKKTASAASAALSTAALFQRLLVKDRTLHVVDAPVGFELTVPIGTALGFELPPSLGEDDAVLAFVKDRAAVDALAKKLARALDDDAETLLWLAYPKGSGGVKTDISRDKGWEAVKALGYEGVAIVSVDDDWSAFRLRHRSRTTRRG